MKRLLLHVCCGPCSIYPIRILREEGYEVTGCFVNPNIHPLAEYLARREAMEQVATRLDLPMIWRDDAYDLPGWLDVVHKLGIASNPDGARCRYCYESRLALTAAIAAAEGFDAFSTSLLYSRYQRHEDIRAIGQRIADHPEEYGAIGPNGSPDFCYRDFRPGWQEGIDVSKDWGIYRQKYCACIFSEVDRYAKKLHRLVEKGAA